jgi:hypothetical protein
MTLKPHMCWICGKAVDLNNCKTDERGRRVHESCYVARTVKSEPPQAPKSRPQLLNLALGVSCARF